MAIEVTFHAGRKHLPIVTLKRGVGNAFAAFNASALSVRAVGVGNAVLTRIAKDQVQYRVAIAGERSFLSTVLTITIAITWGLVALGIGCQRSLAQHTLAEANPRLLRIMILVGQGEVGEHVSINEVLEPLSHHQYAVQSTRIINVLSLPSVFIDS